ncbi:hypothetical protein TrVFT333_007122 [Trichoderma virens FT-333]|nr:hypothetical protein TrVFT333_007122 [Trichoderma virens FT-333]
MSSNMVRDAEFVYQPKKADKFELKGEDDIDLSDVLTNYYSKLIKREFRGMQDTLVQRLVASMLTRRRRIMYRQSQQQRWKIQPVEHQSKNFEPAPSWMMDTTLDANIRHNISAPSGIYKGGTASLNEQSKQLVPPPPKGIISGTDFVCDYCCCILPSHIALNSDAWADHVIKDLYPYVCVVDNCNDPIEIFSTQKEWLTHTSDNLEEHIAQHLRDLALRSLPWPDDDEQNSQPEGEGYLHSDSTTSNEDTRNTIGDFISESESLASCCFTGNPDDNDISEDNAGQRLRLYYHIQKIADQYQPLYLQEQLSDKILARLALKKHQRDHPRLPALMQNHKVSSGNKHSYTAAFDGFLEIVQKINKRTLPRCSEFNRPIVGAIKAPGFSVQPSAKPARNFFEIAIICTRFAEYNAICLLFDKFWDDYRMPDRFEENIYIAGQVKKHNVVLALLPQSEKLTAATAMAHFRLIYPSLNLFLLVGICGSVPKFKCCGRKVKPLLGDVVISHNVVEYQIGSTNEFTRKDSLVDRHDNSRTISRCVYNCFGTKKDREILQKTTAKFLIKIQANAKDREEWAGEAMFKYSYPGTATDQLFKPDYLHKHRTRFSNCSECKGGPDVICDGARQASCKETGCDEGQLIFRTSFKKKQAFEQISRFAAQKPKIHLEPIASNSIVIRNGLERDKISKEQGVIAFDMGGSWEMKMIPHVYIKGICDYADGHTDKRWQDFAAATAAAATKALLWALN